jgi:hypothetical protein
VKHGKEGMEGRENRMGRREELDRQETRETNKLVRFLLREVCSIASGGRTPFVSLT